MRELILNTPYSQNQRQRPHPFPVVDFKFRNTGNGAAFLTKFNIEILEARVDITPELRFQWELAGDKTSSSVDRSFRRWLGSCGDTLSVLAGNVGWGPALNFHLTFADDLSHLFKRIGKGADSVCDDNFVTVRTLSLEDLDKGCFLIAAERCAAGWRNSLNRPKDELSLFRRRRATPEILKFLDDGVAFVDVDHIQFDWGCSASDGSVYDDSETLSINGGSGLDGSLLLITQESFMYVPGEVLCGAAMPPGPTFCALIEPEKGRHSREYPISRRIDPGDVERFQVLIGASKSCFLDVRISFDIDGQERRAASGIFALHIENRRDQKYHSRYGDGQEILAEVTEAQEREARREMRRDARMFPRFADY